MSVSAKYIKSALKCVEDSRQQRILEAENKKQAVYSEFSELQKIDDEIAEVFGQLLKKMMAGENVDFAAAEKISLELKEKKRQFLLKKSINEAAFLPEFECDICGDTGYINGSLCECVKKKATELIYKNLNKDVPLESCTFEKFKLSHYSSKPNDEGEIPREIMTKIYDFCKKYAEKFEKNAESLLFFGATGVGKTHISLAIANEVIKKRYNVIYGSLAKIIGGIEKEHFSGGNERATLDSVIDCDLLIFDDFGTEFLTQFVASAIFDIINSRILKNKPTIINTNLDVDELRERYSDRIVSRICGCYRLFQFYGEDIRIK